MRRTRRGGPRALWLLGALAGLGFGVIAPACEATDEEGSPSPAQGAGDEEDEDVSPSGGDPALVDEDVLTVSPREAEVFPADLPIPTTLEACLEQGLTVRTWELEIGEEGMAELLEDVAADVEVNGTLHAEGESYELGVELQGFSSRHFPKKSFKLKFKGDEPFEGVAFGEEPEPEGIDKLLLKGMYKDQSLIREHLAWYVLDLMGLEAPRVSWVNLVLDGEYYGLFALVEPFDDDYLDRLAYPPGGSLYKAVKQKGGFKPGTKLEAGYEKKLLADEPWDDLETLVDRIQQTPFTWEAYWALIDPWLSLERVRARIIWVSFTQNLDTTTQSFFLYREPGGGEPHWWQLAWDSDICFANHWSLKEDIFKVTWRHMLNGPTWMGQAIAQDPDLREWLIVEFEELLDTLLTPDLIAPIAEQAMAHVQHDLRCEHLRWDRSSSPEEELSEILDFLVQRPIFLREKLEELRDDPGMADEPY